MTALSKLADFRRADSPARRFRARRFELFRSLLDRLPRPVRILDVGGTVTFWRTLGLYGEEGISITTLNLEVDPKDVAPGIEALQGDARDLSRFGDRAFDVVFSNSVIEHVGGKEDQRRAAREMQRVGRAYFVQTPNRWFPIEPHFLFPFFQFLPRALQVYLLTHLSLGWCGKLTDRAQARREAEGIDLLTRRRFREFFPEAAIWKERFYGLVKSFVAYGGFPAG
jgi:hypothetical protein